MLCVLGSVYTSVLTIVMRINQKLETRQYPWTTDAKTLDVPATNRLLE